MKLSLPTLLIAIGGANAQHQHRRPDTDTIVDHASSASSINGINSPTASAVDGGIRRLSKSHKSQKGVDIVEKLVDLLYSFKEEYYGSYSELAEQANGVVAPAAMMGAKSHKESSAKSGKALSCPAEEDGSCLTDTRKADLLAKFGIPINSTSDSGYDELPDTFLQSFGFAVPNSGNRLIINDLEGFESFNEFNINNAYVIPISHFNCIEEAFALGASACNENEFCTYFSANQEYDKSGYDVQFRFFSAESETATSDGTAIENGPNVSGFPGAPRVAQKFTVFKKTTQAALTDISDRTCNVPPSTLAPLAFTCLGVFANDAGATLGQYNGGCCGDTPPLTPMQCEPFVDAFNAAAPFNFTQAGYCSCGPGVGGDLGGANLVTDDFIKFIAPAAVCFDNDPEADLGQCLDCATKVLDPIGCIAGPLLCEEDDAKNFITATPCVDGVQTADCICDACGEVCGTTCKAETQVAISCQLGSPAAIVQDPLTGNFQNSGSCLNSNTGPGSARDFSCPSSE